MTPRPRFDQWLGDEIDAGCRPRCGMRRSRRPGTAPRSGFTATSPPATCWSRRQVRSDRLWLCAVGDPDVRHGNRLDLFQREEPGSLPFPRWCGGCAPGARPRLGAVEGADHGRLGSRARTMLRRPRTSTARRSSGCSPITAPDRRARTRPGAARRSQQCGELRCRLGVRPPEICTPWAPSTPSGICPESMKGMDTIRSSSTIAKCWLVVIGSPPSLRGRPRPARPRA